MKREDKVRVVGKRREGDVSRRVIREWSGIHAQPLQVIWWNYTLCPPALNGVSLVFIKMVIHSPGKFGKVLNTLIACCPAWKLSWFL